MVKKKKRKLEITGQCGSKVRKEDRDSFENVGGPKKKRYTQFFTKNKSQQNDKY